MVPSKDSLYLSSLVLWLTALVLTFLLLIPPDIWPLLAIPPGLLLGFAALNLLIRRAGLGGLNLFGILLVAFVLAMVTSPLAVIVTGLLGSAFFAVRASHGIGHQSTALASLWLASVGPMVCFCVRQKSVFIPLRLH